MDERARLRSPCSSTLAVALLLTSAMMFIYFGFLSHSTKRSWDRWWFQDSAWASCWCIGYCLSMGADLYLRALGEQQL